MSERIYDLAGVIALSDTVGTGDYQLGAAHNGYLTPAQAGAVAGRLYAASVFNALPGWTRWERGLYRYQTGPARFERVTIRDGSAGPGTPTDWQEGDVQFVIVARQPEDVALLDTEGHLLPAAAGSSLGSVATPWAAAHIGAQISGVLAPPQITADQDDYAPAGWESAKILVLESDAPRALTGLALGFPGREAILFNNGSHDLRLRDQNTSSTASHRFGFGRDIVIPPLGSVAIFYRGGRWRVVAEPPRLRTTQIFTNSGTWTHPAGLRMVKVTVVGGGGGGGGASSENGASSAGGSGAGASIKWIPASALAATETVTIGPGGTSGADTGGNGGSGGTSSFGSHCSATGGGPGEGSTSASSVSSGADGGDGAGGDINVRGSGAAVGQGVGGAVGGAPSAGGGSIFGGGARSRNALNGVSAQTPGAGGAGARRTGGNNRAGGAGAPGIVIVEEFY